MSPTVLRVERYRFFFFSNEGHEPAHVHVQDGSKLAKFWLESVRLAASPGFAPRGLTRVQALVTEHCGMRGHFGGFSKNFGAGIRERGDLDHIRSGNGPETMASNPTDAGKADPGLGDEGSARNSNHIVGRGGSGSERDLGGVVVCSSFRGE